ncbi:MAG: ABC transporter substrate-binding protein [Candidatus Omnitrophica bacterium]|nr:ABC transporter substrate-binding protein [Candidatus Omnitrophota bacterium]
MKIRQFTICLVILLLTQGSALYAAQSNYRGKKILYVNSYHKGYDWSDGEQRGAQRALSKTGVDLKIVYMDTKNNPSVDSCKEAALRVKKIIDEFKPDVLITSDDNAFVYVVVPYFRDTSLPVVFCGFNWDMSSYGAPYKNTTGMIEIGLNGELYSHLRKFSKGNRVGFLCFDAAHERAGYKRGIKYIKSNSFYPAFVKDFSSWKREFLNLQDKSDMIIIGSREGIQGWDEAEATNFIYNNVRVPTGSDMDLVAPFCLIGLLKLPEEQGEYAALAALRILNGEKPYQIPVVNNRKGILLLNFDIAGKLGIIFPPSMIKSAQKIINKE